MLMFMMGMRVEGWEPFPPTPTCPLPVWLQHLWQGTHDSKHLHSTPKFEVPNGGQGCMYVHIIVWNDCALTFTSIQSVMKYLLSQR